MKFNIKCDKRGRMMNENLYNTTVLCPVCESELVVTKVKTRGIKVLSRDSDFCVNYEGLNPLFYEIWVCDFCGYAAQKDEFDKITKNERIEILKTISYHWTKRSFAGERNVDNAIEVFKLALLNMQVRKTKASELSKILIRLAWLYRSKGDEKEKEYLELALRCYTEIYEKERFPVDKLDEFTCIYMIAELNRRLGNYEDAVRWFSKIISASDARKNRNLMRMTREQYYLTKEQMGKLGQTSDV